jgi:anti-anti-sigma factor
MFADELHKLEIDLVIDGEYAAINVAGELDTTSAPRLIDTVHDLTALPVRRIDLNCGRVWFLDSAGVRALIVARNEATRMGVDLGLADMSETVHRILDMTGLTGTLARTNSN